jgi:hypothetical protein
MKNHVPPPLSLKCMMFIVTTDFFKRNVTFLFRWMQQINQSGVGSRPKELKGEEKEKKAPES